MERKLAAILAADVVGYSRLMEQNEASTFERLRAYRKELFEPAITNHQGRIFKLMGDGLLAEFGSVVDAVECAVLLQRGMAERNSDLPEVERIEVRIGVHLGDVIIEDDDRHGDAVNIAARLQQLAEPGGICLSRIAVDQVRHKVALDFDLRGEERLKNITEPVTVYRVLADRIAKPPPTQKPNRTQWLWRVAVALAVILVIAAGSAAAWHFYPRLPSPDSRSIAVLPFVNMSGDATENYLGEGMADDIITELSTFPTLQVVARTSSFVYDKPVKVQQVARDLGVHYVLEGSFRTAGDKARITAQLIDATTGAHVWANRYDEESENVVVLQQNVAGKIYASLAGLTGEIQTNLAEEAWRKSSTSLGEYDYYLRGHALLFRDTKEDVAKARQIWQEGLVHFPESALLRVKICFAIEIGLFREWSDDPAADIDLAWKLATEAQAIENKSRLATWLGHWAMAFLYQWHEGDFDRSAAEARAAIDLVPYEARSRADLSFFITNAGKTDEAIDWAQEALRLDPKGPDWFRTNLAWAYYHGNRPEEALAEVKKLDQPPEFLTAAIYARLGRLDEARATMDGIRKRWPTYTIKDEAIFPSGKHPQLKEPLLQAYLDDLRKAGLPE